jgi:hypothetical protein
MMKWPTPIPPPLHQHRLLSSFPPLPLLLLPSLLLFVTLLPTAAAQECTAQGNVAIFMVFQAENPDIVFFSENGCLAGGGRGSGCCQGVGLVGTFHKRHFCKSKHRWMTVVHIKI